MRPAIRAIAIAGARAGAGARARTAGAGQRWPIATLTGRSDLAKTTVIARHKRHKPITTAIVQTPVRAFSTSPPLAIREPQPVDPLRAQLSDLLSPTARGKSTDKRLALAIDNQFLSVDHLHLRDACTCNICVDPSTKQKLFQTQDIPLNIRARKLHINPIDESVTITWSTDFMGYDHVSHYSQDQLRALVSHRASVRSRYDDMNYVLWDRQIMEKDVQFLPYKDYMEDEEVLLFALQQLVLYGLVFLKDVPKDPESIARIAERVGNLKETFYGRTWDVKSTPNSKNIAYTSLDLGLHMDLLYYESPPGLQFLHTLANSVTGGSSYFADSFRAVELIRINSPNAFKSLTTFPVNFHYHNDNQHYFYSRPTVVLDPYSYHTRQRIDHVNYSPPFQAPFDIPSMVEKHPGATSQWRQFFHALGMFGDSVGNKENQYTLKMGEGECAIFQNRRVLHARTAFDAESGERWLKGAYVDGDAYRSKLRVLLEKHKKKQDTLGTDTKYSYIR